jgi:hypothetical protein
LDIYLSYCTKSRIHIYALEIGKFCHHRHPVCVIDRHSTWCHALGSVDRFVFRLPFYFLAFGRCLFASLLIMLVCCSDRSDISLRTSSYPTPTAIRSSLVDRTRTLFHAISIECGALYLREIIWTIVFSSIHSNSIGCKCE